MKTGGNTTTTTATTKTTAKKKKLNKINKNSSNNYLEKVLHLKPCRENAIDTESFVLFHVELNGQAKFSACAASL